MLIRYLLWEFVLCWILYCWQSAVQVSKLCHNLTLKPLIQNSPILFQDIIALSLHCMFQPLVFSNRGENANNYLAEWHTHTHTHTHTHDDYCMPPGLHPLRHNSNNNIYLYLYCTCRNMTLPVQYIIGVGRWMWMRGHCWKNTSRGSGGHSPPDTGAKIDFHITFMAIFGSLFSFLKCSLL